MAKSWTNSKVHCFATVRFSTDLDGDDLGGADVALAGLAGHGRPLPEDPDEDGRRQVEELAERRRRASRRSEERHDDAERWPGFDVATRENHIRAVEEIKALSLEGLRSTEVSNNTLAF